MGGYILLELSLIRDRRISPDDLLVMTPLVTPTYKGLYSGLNFGSDSPNQHNLFRIFKRGCQLQREISIKMVIFEIRAI